MNCSTRPSRAEIHALSDALGDNFRWGLMVKIWKEDRCNVIRNRLGACDPDVCENVNREIVRRLRQIPNSNVGKVRAVVRQTTRDIAIPKPEEDEEEDTVWTNMLQPV